MAWHGKPSGGYAVSSTEGTENIYEMHYMLDAAGYTLESQAGVIGNVVNESALNVWRWQGDSVNMYYGGYGLFQYTASSSAATDRYIDVCSGLPYYAPNLSTSSITQGAQVTDAICQMNVFTSDYLNKWVSTVWRSYWPANQTLRNMVNNILATWGNGSTLSQYQFSQITSVSDAAVAFLGAFEGPAYPNYQVRINSANEVYQILQGAPPGPGPGPGPTPTGGRKMPVWMMLKPQYHRF